MHTLKSSLRLVVWYSVAIDMIVALQLYSSTDLSLFFFPALFLFFIMTAFNDSTLQQEATTACAHFSFEGIYSCV